MKALLLEGGGAKGAYQAGAIKALCKKGLYFDAVGGTSIGAINAAYYACRNLHGMYKLWQSTDSSYLFGFDSNIVDSFDFNFEDFKAGFNTIKKIIKNKGIDTDNIRNLLNKSLNEKRFRRSSVNFGLNTFSLSDMKPVEIFKKDIPEGKLVEYIMASAYLPIFKFEKIIDDKYYIDGGVHENCPINMFIKAGYDEIFVIKAWRKPAHYKKKKGVKVDIVTPRESLGSIVKFNPDVSNYRMNLGYYDTLKYLDNLDGDKYYFKYKDDKYYNNLFDKETLKLISKKYNKSLPILNKKEFIISMLEKICKDFKIERFKIHNIPFLLVRLKSTIDKRSKYYLFLSNIKIDFS